MDTQTRKLCRAAVALRERYLLRRRQMLEEESCRGIEDLVFTVTLAARQARLVRRGSERGWSSAAARFRRSYRRSLEDANRRLQELREFSYATPDPIPQVCLLLEELQATADEFELQIVRREGRISATTQSIELDGVRLGPFRIDLILDRIDSRDSSHWFLIEALEPVAAAGHPSTVHPHVNDGYLCLGEAGESVERALREGRLSDFFMLARSVLETYNAGSAYAELDEWSGEPCATCETRCSHGDSCSCDECGATLCDDCLERCVGCSFLGCGSCMERSEFSDEWVCPRCASSCSECARRGAKSELTGDVCRACWDQINEENDDEPECQDASPGEASESDEAEPAVAGDLGPSLAQAAVRGEAG